MKYLILFSLLLTGCALAQPPASKFTVRVLDAEVGLPVTNAVAEVTFEHDYDPYGNRPDKVDIQKKTVNQNGEVSFSGHTIQRGAGARVFAEDYYWGGCGAEYKTKNLAINRWEPWNPTFEVKMRPKKNPVPMIHKFQKWIVVPQFGKMVGYDLKIGDWVSPYGKGETRDFIFVMNLNRKSMSDAEAFYTLSFSNPLDGIQEYLPEKEIQSSYIFPYIAPSTGYQKSLYQHDINTPFGPSETTEKKNINYIFRVRTVTDQDGRIISACYGRIKGEVKISRKGQVEFSYWFNPDPKSRSLESLEEPY